jgi:hypothetical protein
VEGGLLETRQPGLCVNNGVGPVQLALLVGVLGGIKSAQGQDVGRLRVGFTHPEPNLKHVVRLAPDILTEAKGVKDLEGSV